MGLGVGTVLAGQIPALFIIQLYNSSLFLLSVDFVHLQLTIKQMQWTSYTSTLPLQIHQLCTGS